MEVPHKSETRLVQWVVETDFAFEISDDRSDEEIVKAFFEGEFDHIEKTNMGSRISQYYPISVNIVKRW